LKEESDTAIPAAPPIIAKKMEWNRSEVRRGEEVKINAQFEGIE
jgi:hypothetical protein